MDYDIVFLSVLDTANREPAGAVTNIGRTHRARIEVENVGSGGVRTTRPVVAVGTLRAKHTSGVTVAGSGKMQD